MSRLLRTGLLLAGSLVLLGARPTLAFPQTALPQAASRPVNADSLLDARTREVASQLRCPVCQGLSLQDSPSELSQEMRDVVRQQLAAGKTPEQVRAYFVARYGEWILMTPQAHGLNWIVYVLPFLVFAGGGWMLVVALRKWTATAQPGSAAAESGGTRTIL